MLIGYSLYYHGDLGGTINYGNGWILFLLLIKRLVNGEIFKLSNFIGRGYINCISFEKCLIIFINQVSQSGNATTSLYEL